MSNVNLTGSVGTYFRVARPLRTVRGFLVTVSVDNRIKVD